jgi:hypothetical protein
MLPPRDLGTARDRKRRIERGEPVDQTVHGTCRDTHSPHRHLDAQSTSRAGVAELLSRSSEQRRCKASFSRSVISGARAVRADDRPASADLTSLPAFGFRPVPDIGVLFGAFEEFIARIALQDVSAFLKINHGIAARQA